MLFFALFIVRDGMLSDDFLPEKNAILALNDLTSLALIAHSLFSFFLSLQKQFQYRTKGHKASFGDR